MSYEITTIAERKADVSRDCTFVSGRARKARYAVAALRSQISSIFDSPQYKTKDITTYKPRIDKKAIEVINSVPQVQENSFKKKLKKIFSSKEKIEEVELVGIDITPSCIYVCQIDNTGGKSALTGLASVCVEGKFVSDDIINNPEVYSDSLKKLVAENKIKSTKVAVSLPVSSSITRVATISKMCDADISRAIKYGSLWQNLMGKDESADNYSVFYQVIRREKKSDTMDILLVATKLSDIDLYRNIVTNSGLDPVVIDAKSMALHYALKKRPNRDMRYGTVLIEFGLENNHIMVMGAAAPRVFSMNISDAESAAMLGLRANGSKEIIDALVERYLQKLRTIMTSYRVIKPFVAIEDVYITSSSPLISDFVTKLSESLTECNVRECSMFDYIQIPDNFAISKKSAENNISSWIGAIGMAMMSWKNYKEEWIEVRKSPSYGVKFIRHYNKFQNIEDLSVKIGEIDPHEKIYTQASFNLSRFASIPNLVAASIAVFAVVIMANSYFNMVENSRRLDLAISSESYIVTMHNNKQAEIAAMQAIVDKMAELDNAAVQITQDSNQKYVISMYDYLDKVMAEGVWLKQLTFTAPYQIELEGRANEDSDVISFLGTLNDSEAFSQIALKHMQSISELDMFSRESISLKSFILNGNLSETLPDAPLKSAKIMSNDVRYGR